MRAAPEHARNQTRNEIAGQQDDGLIPGIINITAAGINTGRAVLRTIKGARFTSWGEREVDVRDGRAVVPDDASGAYLNIDPMRAAQ